MNATLVLWSIPAVTRFLNQLKGDQFAVAPPTKRSERASLS